MPAKTPATTGSQKSDPENGQATVGRVGGGGSVASVVVVVGVEAVGVGGVGGAGGVVVGVLWWPPIFHSGDPEWRVRLR